ncbi:MAG: hypothetical protein HY051_04710 [Candidatus Aenigmarchaeota archaeon]|nr:hypothetical protein [Candidatus Aenigmarchaeota archaeon]
MKETIVTCPFCSKEITVNYSPSIRYSKTEITATLGRRTKWFHTKERYETIEDCPNCHKSKKEIQKALNGEMLMKPKSKEDLKRQLEELGLSGKL